MSCPRNWMFGKSWVFGSKQTVIARKGHEIVAVSFFRESLSFRENISVHAGRRIDVMFFWRRICSLSG
jgi:hypothetical protein